jgi:hypothetical protein
LVEDRAVTIRADGIDPHENTIERGESSNNIGSDRVVK